MTQVKIKMEKAMAPHSSTLAWKIPGLRSLVRLQSMRLLSVRHNWATSFHFSLSCIGEGNGNPLQCSCLENPRDGGVWWTAIYGVTQSQTRLKQFSSCSIDLNRLLVEIWMSRALIEASLIIQWLRICLAMQGPWVQSLVRELRSHSLWSNWIHVPLSTCMCHSGGSHMPQLRPKAAKKRNIKKKKKRKETEEHGRKTQIAKVGRKLSVQVNKPLQTEQRFLSILIS